MKVTAGDLSRIAVVKRWADESFGEDQTKSIYDRSFSARVSLQPVSGAVFYGAVQVGDSVTHKITLRWVKGKTDPESLGHGYVIEIDGWRYRPVRAYDLFGKRKYTVIEAVQHERCM